MLWHLEPCLHLCGAGGAAPLAEQADVLRGGIRACRDGGRVTLLGLRLGQPGVS